MPEPSTGQSASGRPVWMDDLELQATMNRSSITPENATSARFFKVITHTGNPSVGQVTVSLPVDTVCHLHV